METAQNLYHSKIFIHFVKNSVLPALVLFSSKILFMLLFSAAYGLEYSFGNQGIVFNDTNSFILANDYSSILTYLVAFSFTCWLIFKGFYLHHSHISPNLSSWLHAQSLENLIVKNFDLYVRTATWIIFLWIITVLILIHFILGLTSNWIFYIPLAMSSILTILAVIDIEKEHTLFLSNN